jgi:hypothetical protein
LDLFIEQLEYLIPIERANLVENDSQLLQVCTVTRDAVPKPAHIVGCLKSRFVVGYCESLHSACSAISAHVPVNLLDPTTRLWGSKVNAQMSEFRPVVSAGLQQARCRPAQLESRIVHFAVGFKRRS